MYSKTIIVGRIVHTPELKQTPNGVPVCTFTVAVDRPYKKKGEEKHADFYDTVAWRSTGEFVARYFSKGNPILVEGHMESRTYTDKNSQKRRVWELIADGVSFTGGKNESHTAPDIQSESSKPANNSTDDFTEIGDDGDLPF